MKFAAVRLRQEEARTPLAARARFSNWFHVPVAVWSGAGASIGKSLDLRLQPGALIGVTGRLVDTARRPIHTKQAAAIRWQDKPRGWSTYFELSVWTPYIWGVMDWFPPTCGGADAGAR